MKKILNIFLGLCTHWLNSEAVEVRGPGWVGVRSRCYFLTWIRFECWSVNGVDRREMGPGACGICYIVRTWESEPLARVRLSTFTV